MESETDAAEVRTYFVRGRNALVARSQMSPLFVDYYLHLADCGVQISPDLAVVAKNALTAVTLHSASRPRAEVSAWTVNFQDPLMNLFAAGDNPCGTVVANVFTENVREGARNLFYSDTIKDQSGPRRSVVDFEAQDIFHAVEQFYFRSEQRLARFFRHGDEDFVFVVAQPQCDEDWLRALTDEAIRTLDESETLSLLEQRYYRFKCGCTQERMMRVLLSPFRQDPEALFGDEQVVRIQCPRCGARHAISREAMEAMERSEDAAGDAK